MPSAKLTAGVKPFVKWAGGKSRSAARLLSLMPSCVSTYVEPFVGSGAIYFRMSFDRAVINDLNPELICAYRQVRDNVDKLKALLRTFRYDKTVFLETRAWDRDPLFESRTELERAARLIFLVKTCYNGLYRVNRKNHFNSPFGRYENPTICDDATLEACSAFLNSHPTEICNQDYGALLDRIPAGSFVYLDPPYHPLNATSFFTSYQPGPWDRGEQERLFEFCAELDKRGVRFLQSNSASPFIEGLYGNFRLRYIEAGRSINADAAKRSAVRELVITNY